MTSITTAQIALIPATPAWSRHDLRKSVEHSLEKERQRHRDGMMLSLRMGTPSTTGLLFLFVVFAGLLLFPHGLPGWFLQACTTLFFSGQLPHLSFPETILFYGGLVSLLVAPIILTMIVDLLKKHVFGNPLYDQLQVARKTGQMAYQACIHLYVFGPGNGQSRRQIASRYTHLLARSVARKIQRGKYRFFALLWFLLRGVTRKRPKPWLRMIFLKGAVYVLHKMRTLKRTKPSRSMKLVLRGRRHWKEETDWRRFQRDRRTEVLASLVAAYRQFDTASAGYFVTNKIRDAKALRLVRAQWSNKVTRSRHFITADFLSRAWYLPKASMFELPGIEQKRSRTLLVPPCLIAPPGQRAIGSSRHAGYAFPFALPTGFLGQHTLIGGKTGEGKSTLMIHIAREAMKEGALCLIDPHGDLALDVLRSIPQERLDDVVFVDLGDTAYSVGLNPLDATLGRDRDLIVAALVGAFSTIWESGWGTRMEAPFRSALLTLIEANEVLTQQGKAAEQYTILDVFQLLLDESFCHDVLESVSDIYLHRFWYLYYDTLDDRQQRERIDPVLTKMLQFESQVARRILGQSCSTLNLSELVQKRSIVVIRLAASEAGLAAPILGATLLSLLMVALREQSVLIPEERVGMSIIIDEFQSIPGADYAQLLAELRKFGGAAVLATQSFEYLRKLSPYLQATTMANIKQYFMFRLSADDAHLIAQELNDVSEEDILNLDSYTCYVKLIHQQQQQPTFTLHIEPPELHEREVIDLIRSHSRRYSRLAAEVEQELFEALARVLQATPVREDEQPIKKRTEPKEDAPVVDSTVAQAPAQEKTPVEKQPALKKGRIHFPSKRERASSDDDLITSFDIHPEGSEEREQTL